MEPDAGLLLINQETDLGFYVRYDVPQMFWDTGKPPSNQWVESVVYIYVFHQPMYTLICIKYI